MMPEFKINFKNAGGILEHISLRKGIFFMLYKQQSFSNFEPDLRYLDSFPFSREEFLFFDIETTGFFPRRNTSLYLIGAVCFLDEHWTFLQWFAETPSEECEILNAFLAFCRSFRAVVHFNGDGFLISLIFIFQSRKNIHCQIPYHPCRALIFTA